MRRRSTTSELTLAAVLSVFTGAFGAIAQAENLLDGATVLPTGRLVRPTGAQFDLGDFPLGLAVSPDGALAVATNNGQGFGVNAGFGTFCDDLGKPNQCGQAPAPLVGDPATPTPDESLSVVDLASGAVSEVTAVPTSRDPFAPQFNFFSVGVAFSPDGKHLYATGGGNEAVYDFPVAAGRLLSPPRTLVLPTTVAREPANPYTGSAAGFTKGLAVTPDGTKLLVTKEFDDELDLIDAATLTLEQRLPLGPAVAFGGNYPYAVAVSPEGSRAYVTLQGLGVIEAVAFTPLGLLPLGTTAVGDHPTGLAIAPDGGQILVANADDDTLAVVDSTTLLVTERLTLHAVDGERWGSVPNAVAIAPDGRRAYVALAGDNAVAVLDQTGGAWSLSGLVPVGWYPTAVAALADGRVLAVSAKGLGSRYLAFDPYPVPTVGGPAAIPNSYYYDANNMPGLLSIFANPTAAELQSSTTLVRENLRFATDADSRSPHNPIPARVGDPSPIQHVVYIIRENRTFDQVFGDLGRTRTDVDADPAFELLAAATPNAHAIAARYAISDRFFSDGEASIQGHWWTAAANVNDYVEKSWRQYYSHRNRPYDPVSTVSQPKGCTLFQSALDRFAASAGAFTFRDYGELTGIFNPSIDPALTGDDDDPAERACPALPQAFIDPNFRTNLQSLDFDDRISAAEFLSDVGLAADGTDVGDAAHFLRNLSYVILPEDHTTGFDGSHTPRSQVAQNDAAVGMIVQALSKSRYWPSTAVFVVEDDSQDGPDHVDGHRNVLLVASPWTRHVSSDGSTPGYVGHLHYDQAGVLRTIELVLGLPPLSAYDQQAAPLYGLFQDKDDPSSLTGDDLAPFEVAPPPSFIDEPISAVKGAQVKTLRTESKGFAAMQLDRAGPRLEAVLWRSLRSDPLPKELQQKIATTERR